MAGAPKTRRAIQRCLFRSALPSLLAHRGLAQDVGPAISALPEGFLIVWARPAAIGRVFWSDFLRGVLVRPAGLDRPDRSAGLELEAGPGLDRLG